MPAIVICSWDSTVIKKNKSKKLSKQACLSSRSRHSCERGNRENIQHAQVRVPRAQHVGRGRGLQAKQLRSDAKRLCLPPPFIKFLTFLPRVLRTNFSFSKTYGGTVQSFENMSWIFGKEDSNRQPDWPYYKIPLSPTPPERWQC